MILISNAWSAPPWAHAWGEKPALPQCAAIEQKHNSNERGWSRAALEAKCEG